VIHFALPHDASLDGFRIDRLIALGLWVQIPLLIVLALWLVGAALFWRRRRRAVFDRGSLRHLPAVVVSALALVLLVGLDGMSWDQSNRDLDQHLWNFGAAEADPRTLRIEVDAHQWAWAGRYAGPDGKFGTPDDAITLDDLRVPVDTPILVELTSTDVIHDFYLPNFRLKQDAVPGRFTRLTFTARETGQFEIACSQFCGLNHYKMRGLLTVLPEDAYQRWIASASASSRALYDAQNSIAHWGWEWLTADGRRRQP
jgi:cytochrome c oxidase subunit 2